MVLAAKFTARHPNLVALELSSFKCGHDAPIYTVIESIIERSGTPYFSFKDIDENKPTGSIKIRVETTHYFLKRYAEDMNRKRTAGAAIEEQMAAYERQLRQQMLFDEQLADLARGNARHRRSTACCRCCRSGTAPHSTTTYTRDVARAARDEN